MKIWIPLSALLAGLVALGIMRQREIRELRLENSALRQQQAEAARLQVENGALANASVDLDELNRLRGEKNELLKLRAEATALRQFESVDRAGLEKQIRAAQSAAQAAQQRGDRLRADKKAQDLQKEIMRCLGQIQWLMNAATAANQGNRPMSMAELENVIKTMPLQNHPDWARLFDPSGTNAVSLRSFEFIPTSGRADGASAQISIRERVPRQLPDGTWARAYGFSDGHYEQAIVADGNFADWEQARSH